MAKRPGPVEVTGKYGCRSVLESEVMRLSAEGVTPSNISAETCVAISTIQNILKKHRVAAEKARTAHNKSLISKAWVPQDSGEE